MAQHPCLLSNEHELEITPQVFTESGSPSESLMGKTVSIEIPKRTRRSTYRAARSLPYTRRRSGKQVEDVENSDKGHLNQERIQRGCLGTKAPPLSVCYFF